MARLRRSQLDHSAIFRRRIGRGFRYQWATGEFVDDPVILNRIAELTIPPAWNDVRICPWPNGHIQAIGNDAAGRRQYRYHDQWRRHRDVEKFSHMLDFASALPMIRDTVTNDLNQIGFPKTRVLALGIRLLDIAMFRIGGEEYAEANDTYGVATIQKCHVTIRKNKATFDYPAKSGKQRQITISEPNLVEVISQLKRRRGSGDELLAWRDGRSWCDVRSHELNTYLKDISGGPFSAKDFRTWDATLLCAVLIAQQPRSSSPSARARRIASIVREVSDALGNTPAVCRKAYIDPRIFDRFEHGETIASFLDSISTPFDLANSRQLCKIEQAVIDLLDEHRHVIARAVA